MQSGNRPPFFADRVKIEERLRWMFVRSIAGIDHARLEPLRKKLRSARGAVT